MVTEAISVVQGNVALSCFFASVSFGGDYLLATLIRWCRGCVESRICKYFVIMLGLGPAQAAYEQVSEAVVAGSTCPHLQGEEPVSPFKKQGCQVTAGSSVDS